MSVATLPKPSKHVPLGEPRRTEYRSFRVTPVSPHTGAEIRGLDLSDLSGEELEDIREAWADWLVLVFRDQVLDRQAHKAFGRNFGRLHVHPMHHGRPDEDPEILLVKTTAKSPYTAGEAWHTDVSCDAIPPLGSALYITETPECGGGDTLFANMYMAYEMLSAPMKAFLEGLQAVHDGAMPYVGNYGSAPPEGGYPRHEHPVVTRHPVTGRKVLYVNSGFTTHIAGLQRWESRAILDMCFSLLQREPKLHCRVRWEPNTLTLWDNRCTQHHSVWDYYPYSRYGERVSIVGEEPPAR
ncbi:MAG TPA: TauD/TfdA family dioxygenase [Phenylobacterium sp.]|uniref:TauD/TfdA dioxygenase family protein n=1 Tax=Phenylobacterium sp. TaxID=1871053 RepID=UPI002BCA7AA6|nr:TauD/TfdA family dioxygenase [Phenylobacterium sp.]HSV01690.1 TauD/TfdA family dioxygenase [Phenylobacterium sp.]